MYSIYRLKSCRYLEVGALRMEGGHDSGKTLCETSSVRFVAVTHARVATSCYCKVIQPGR
jgi:hypothetical protein